MGLNLFNTLIQSVIHGERRSMHIYHKYIICADIKEDLYDLQKIVIDNFFILRGLCVCIFIIKSQKMPHVQSGR